MYAADVLRYSDQLALSNNQVLSSDFESSVIGKDNKKLTKKGKGWKKFGAMGLITAIIIILLVFFSAGEWQPSWISAKLTEETDIQQAYGLETKKIALQQSLRDGEFPSDTAQILKENDILVGYEKNGEFIEANKIEGSLSILKDGKIISADNFIQATKNDRSLDKAIDDATYGAAAYYFDEAAEEVFKEIGTTRNNYKAGSKLSNVIDDLMGSGSDINANSVSLVQKTRKNEAGETEIYYAYEENGAAASSKTDAAQFIQSVSDKNKAETTEKSTLDAADMLNTADAISKEQRSSLFFLIFMENISKMKAGDGNTSEINAAMNYLYKSATTEVVDTKNGEIKQIIGTPLDSPSLYAILSDSNLDPTQIESYSSERILKTVKNQLGSSNESGAISGIVASSAPKSKGLIGRLVSSGVESASTAILNLVKPTVSKSLMDNSYETIQGVDAGEFLVEGAINVGRKLGEKSGATAGDAAAVLAYSKMNSEFIARNAEIDRINRSPFDITSKNTFLGSIIYNLATTLNTHNNSIFSSLNSIIKTTSKAIISMTPASYANDGVGFLSNIGDCQKLREIGAVGTAQCLKSGTFDTSTLDDPFNNPEFISFVEENTFLNTSGAREIKDTSKLANFIECGLNQDTPPGIISSKCLKTLFGNIDISSIANMVKASVEASDEDIKMAVGAAFVNSSANPDWQVYKYAQLYVGLDRTRSLLKQNSSDSTAYNNLRFFEGEASPVTAFINKHSMETVANN